MSRTSADTDTFAMKPGEVIVDGIVVLTISIAVLSVLLRIWQFHPHVPIYYEGDGVMNITGFSNMLGHWSYFYSGSVGYPFGQHLQDFPAAADGLCLLLSWILVNVLRDPVFAMNVFFLSTFPLSALGGLLGSRLAGLRRTTGILVGVLYAFVPFHGMHGAAHIYLSMYPMIPIVLGVVIKELRYPSRLDSPIRSRQFLAGAAPIAIVGVLGGMSGLYYSFFTIVILSIALVLTLGDRNGLKSAVRFAVGAGLALITVAVQMIPILWYQHAKGANLSILKRGAFEVEYYSLRFIDLLLPIPQHPLHPLAAFTLRNVSVHIPGEGTSYLGFLGALGVVILVAGFLAPKAAWVRRTGISAMSRLFVVLVLCSTLGGVNQILASVGFTQIRVWSRISIVLAFLALVSLFKILEALFESLGQWRSWSNIFLVLLLLFGTWDTNRPVPNDAYTKNSRAWHNDQDLVRKIEDVFGPGARILQLPVLRFPEQGPVEKLGDYSQLRGHLHSKSLCWSYGVVIGRDGGRTARWQGLEIPELLNEARDSGFDAVWLELRAYGDAGEQVMGRLRNELGAPVLSDQSALVVVFDMRMNRTQRRANCKP